MAEQDKIIEAGLDAERRLAAAGERVGKSLSEQVGRHDEKSDTAIAETRLFQQKMIYLNRSQARSLRMLKNTADLALPNGKKAAVAKSLEWALRIIYILVGLLAVMWMGPSAIKSVLP